MVQTANKSSFIPLAKPSINDADIALVAEVLRSGMLVQGTYVEKLENAFATYHNVKHAIAVSNGTATLHLALKVLGIGSGDEVIVPAFSYIATANVVELVGAKPVFVDIDKNTFNIDVAQVEACITPKTKAIIPVHEFGLACDIELLSAICKKHNIAIIEDAACALGSKQNDQLVGTFGILGSFSLHPRKSITSGEGGVLLTDSDELATKLRQLRNHGIEMENGKMNFVAAGYNYRMTDFQAALAYGQFSRIDAILSYKNELASLYMEQINSSKFILPFQPSDRNHTWQTFHVLMQDGLDQDETISYLKKKGVGTNYGAQCIPSQTYYQQKYQLNAKELFPNAYKAYTKGLAVPLYDGLSKEDVMYVAETINEL